MPSHGNHMAGMGINEWGSCCSFSRCSEKLKAWERIGLGQVELSRFQPPEYLRRRSCIQTQNYFSAAPRQMMKKTPSMFLFYSDFSLHFSPFLRTTVIYDHCRLREPSRVCAAPATQSSTRGQGAQASLSAPVQLEKMPPLLLINTRPFISTRFKLLLNKMSWRVGCVCGVLLRRARFPPTYRRIKYWLD